MFLLFIMLCFKIFFLGRWSFVIGRTLLRSTQMKKYTIDFDFNVDTSYRYWTQWRIAWFSTNDQVGNVCFDYDMIIFCKTFVLSNNISKSSQFCYSKGRRFVSYFWQQIYRNLGSIQFRFQTCYSKEAVAWIILWETSIYLEGLNNDCMDGQTCL